MKALEKWFDLEGKKVLITGASGQLGTAFAGGFKLAGARVFGFDLNPTAETGIFDSFATGDIRTEAEVKAAFKALLGTGGAFDVLVNNAGISTSASFRDRTEADFEDVLSVNVKGSFYCSREFVKRYEVDGNGSGAIINVGSIYGVLAPDFRIYTDYGFVTPEVYGISKAGILQLTRYLAVLYAKKGLRVNAISPGGILNRANPQGRDFVERYSERVPMGRMAEADEMVAPVLFLAGKGASYVTGQNIMVDGGLSSW